MDNYWGYHLTIDAAGCDPVALRSATTIAAFAKELVEKIDMVAFGEPQVVHFGEGNKAGYTLVQLIETSNITAHFAEETNDIYLDVFSCKPFEINDVFVVFDKYFASVDFTYDFKKRQAPQGPGFQLKVSK